MTTKIENFAYVFPGQGSQVVGMGLDLANKFKLCRAIFDQADEILGFKLSRFCWEGPSEALNDTINTQPALFVHSIAALKLLEHEHPEINPVFIAGHSLGEITALVAAGSISFEDGLRLVRKRGELMQTAGKLSPGGMAAVLGMDVIALEEVCLEASNDTGRVQIANDNCPGQIVISGEVNALERAMNAAKEKGARKIRPLAVSIAAHSDLMLSAKVEFHKTIEEIKEFKDSTVPIISNVLAKPISTASELKKDILDQLTSRVRWTESIRYLLENRATTFIEIGSGNVLTGLLKRIDEVGKGFSYGTLENIEEFNRAMDVSNKS